MAVLDRFLLYSTCHIACSLIAVKVMLSSEKYKLYFKLK